MPPSNPDDHSPASALPMVGSPGVRPMSLIGLERESREQQIRFHGSPEGQAAPATLLEGVLEGIPDAFYALDEHLRLTHANRHACLLWGKPREELIGRSLADVLPEGAMSEAWIFHEAVLRSREPLQVEVPSAGRWFWFTIHPLAGGGLTVCCRDVTPSKEAETALRESEERLRKVTDRLPVLIAYVDAEHRYRFNNKAYETWLGCSPESIQGAHLRDVLGWMRYEAIKPFVQAALAGQPVGYEAWVELPDGKRYVKTEYIPEKNADGQVDGFYVLISDITGYWHSQNALAQSEARLRLALDAGRMAIWELDAASDTIGVNPELNRLLGIPSDIALTSEEIRSRYYPGERGRLQEAAVGALARGERYVESELQIVGYDGTPRWLLLRAELQDIRNGQPMRMLGVALDITERKKNEEHQRLLLNELNHRVKNTLATVQSIASQSLRNAASAAEARSAIEGRLLALSRAHDVLTREHWDGASLQEVVQQGIAPFQSHGQGRFDIQGEDMRLPPRVALSVAMALQELGTNAVKYGALSTEGGRIAIRWTLTGTGEGKGLELLWQETGGPPVAEPTRKGFGTRLIERSLAQELHGDVSIAFMPAGLICSIRATLPHVGQAPPAKPVM